MPYLVIDPATAAAAPVTTLGQPKTNVGMTLGDYTTELLQLLGNRSDVIDDTDRQKRWINRGYHYLCDSVDLSELHGSMLMSLVASQPFYNLPDQVSFVKYLAIVDTVDFCEGGRKLNKIDLAMYRNRADVDAASPSEYFRYNRTLVVWPTPDTSYSAALDFKIRPDDLVNDNDSPLLPTEWHEGILLAARWRALRDLQDFQSAAVAQNDYVSAIRPLLDTDAEESASRIGMLSPARRLRDFYRNRV